MDRALQYTQHYETAGRVSGWRKTAFYLTVLTAVITCLLLILLIVSLHAIDGGGASTSDETIFYTGPCDRTSKVNLVIHLVINIVGTCIIGSSNFFMQVLVAPTRHDIDRAHTSGHWMEIGVNSMRNFRFVSRFRTSLWAFIAFSSVPLHLLFNGCVLESKTTNDFLALMVSETFLDGARFSLPAVVPVPRIDISPSYNTTIRSIQQSLADYKTGQWEHLAFKDCMDRYNDLEKAMIDHRHVIMVMSNQNNTPGSEWTGHDIYKYGIGGSSVNSLWFLQSHSRTGDSTSPITHKGSNIVPYTDMQLNPTTGVITMDQTYYKPAFHEMKVDYCLSEKSTTSCRLSIANSILLIVFIMCTVKSLLFALTLLGSLALREPLMTIGDAIASFISTPDPETRRSSTLNIKDFTTKGNIHENFASPRSWVDAKRSLAGTAISAELWILSYLFIGIFFLLSGCLLKPTLEAQSLFESRFAHHIIHPSFEELVEGKELSWSLIKLTVMSNIPQLLLSTWYIIHNGLITRMLTEFEWKRYSLDFKGLRVSRPSGQQRSTYRLQVPYRWSVPLLAISAILHWVYSNAVYLGNYEVYSAMEPYSINETYRELQFSPIAILVGLITSAVVALVPIILALFRLPGKMVLAGSNSKVISAACHCVPIRSTDTAGTVSAQPLGVEETNRETLRIMARRQLRWGDISMSSEHEEVGRLAFGVVEQGVGEPVEGKLYN